MREHFQKFMMVVGFICLVALITGLPLWILWNLVAVDIFDVPHITFWQAVGLQIIAGLLFKNTDYKK
jgi:uncharacterized membrane protein